MGEVPSQYEQPSVLTGFLRRNPVALKELRGRMRGARAFIVLTVYVLLMSAFTVILYLIYTASQSVTLSTSGGVVGKLIFGGVVAIELFLVCFIAPAFTSGAISGERERQTFNLLRTTLLPARRIVLGKLLSAMAYIVLLLMAAVPLQSLAFLMGGVVAEEVILSLVLLFVTALCYATAGIFFSAATRRTLSASVLTYAFALLATIVLPLITLVVGSFAAAASFGSEPIIELLLVYGQYLLASTNPIATAVLTEAVLLEHGAVFLFTGTLSNGTVYPVISPWLVYSVFYLLVTFVLVLMSVRQVRRIEA